MSNTLTGTQVRQFYTQLLHIPLGPEATEKPVRTGGGTETVFNLGAASVSFGNIRMSGNDISSKNTNGDITLSPNGTGRVTFSKANITGGTVTGLTNLTATGGTLTGVTFSGSIGTLSAPLTLANGGTGGTDAATARTSLGLGTLATQNANNVNITGGSINGVTLPYETITGRDYGAFYSLVDQSASVNTATPVRFELTTLAVNVSVANNGGGQPTRITFVDAGTYLIAARLQFQSIDVANVNVLVWFSKQGVDIDGSASQVNVPKTSDGGKRVSTLAIPVTVTAGQYVEVYWATPDVDVTLHHDNAIVSPYVAPAVASASVTAVRIA